MTEPHPLTQLLQRLTQRARAFDRRRPLVWDGHVAAFFVCAALVDAGGGWRNTAPDTDVPVWLIYVMSLGLSLPVLWRRSHPMAVLTVMVATGLVNSWSGAMLQAALIQLAVLFSIAMRLPLKTLGQAGLMMTAPLIVGAVRHPEGSWDQQIIPNVWAYALVALLGIAVRSRQDYTRALVERARRLEVERDQQARLATAAERTRIAREMHDIIGHNLSVITGLADGGSYAAAKSPERAAQALEAIGSTSRQALSELRRLLDVLRDDGPAVAERSPQPALTDLGPLIEGVRAAGLPVRSTIHGNPETVPAGRQLTVYRVVQEALTNTLKHGGPDATATVDVVYDEDGVTVDVTDTGRGGPALPADGGGRGLTGMRERTSLYDGTLRGRPAPRPEGRLAGPPPSPEGQRDTVTTVLIVDDQPMQRFGFRMLLESQDDMTVAGKAGNGGEAVRMTAEHHPDVVLMDIRMPGVDGIEATRRIVASGDRTRVLILTTFDLDEYAYDGLRAGASGFLIKDALPEELLSGIRAVASGDAVVAPSLTRRLLDAYADHLPTPGASSPDPADDPRLASLTEREREILTVIGQGWTNAEIASRLHLAESTVKTHVGRILAKTGARDRVQAVILAYDTKLVRPT
ncbi:Protein-glutamate methylesterase/protein-glutamine glutaminase [Streptomyces alboniger]